MSNTVKVIIAALVVVIIAGGAWLLWGVKNTDTNPPSSTTPDTSDSEGGTNSPPASDSEPVAATITYDGTSFTPADISVKSGAKVKIVNQSNEVIEFASDPHPVHTDNPELNTGDITPGKEATITVTTTGDWGFHNHYDPTKHGTLKVE